VVVVSQDLHPYEPPPDSLLAPSYPGMWKNSAEGYELYLAKRVIGLVGISYLNSGGRR
jgi:hypothetical protein